MKNSELIILEQLSRKAITHLFIIVKLLVVPKIGYLKEKFKPSKIKEHVDLVGLSQLLDPLNHKTLYSDQKL